MADVSASAGDSVPVYIKEKGEGKKQLPHNTDVPAQSTDVH